MAFQEKQLAQSAPAGTTAASIYSPGASTTAIIKHITVANTGSGTIQIRIFLDDNGTTYDATTAIAYDVTLARRTMLNLSVYLPMNDATGNLAFRTDTADDACITVFGVEIT